ncbi:carbohydrate ABC transporter permease [Bifidobacterium longum]|uniref:carbohydrate ABC transporter permease n=1 Tax=Bifidobacterium longum TaxID=216816 RepID=UPI00202552E4|nr:carbohydrate ABC transporter permease [Bifidobacterium longum]
MKRGKASRMMVRIWAVLFSVIWLFPVYWMVLTALKPSQSVLESSPTFITAHPSLYHFREAVASQSLMVYLRNSLIVTVAVVAVSVVVSFLACAALTLYRFRGRRFIMVLVMAVQMVPGAAMMIPQFVVFNRFGMLNTYVGLILAYMAMILPFSIWNLRGFFLGMPREVFESARVEGANEWQLMWRITFPLAAPGIVSTCVFAFIHSWNEYMMAYTFMKDQSKYTLPVWLASFSTPSGIDVGAQMAASVLFALPVVVFFMLVRSRIGGGDVSGAIK